LCVFIYKTDIGLVLNNQNDIYHLVKSNKEFLSIYYYT